MCTIDVSPHIYLKWASFDLERSCTQVIFLTQELSPPPLLPFPSRHVSKDVQEHSRLVTLQLSSHFLYQTPY